MATNIRKHLVLNLAINAINVNKTTIKLLPAEPIAIAIIDFNHSMMFK
jgi:hypothetical protein